MNKRCDTKTGRFLKIPSFPISRWKDSGNRVWWKGWLDVEGRRKLSIMERVDRLRFHRRWNSSKPSNYFDPRKRGLSSREEYEFGGGKNIVIVLPPPKKNSFTGRRNGNEGISFYAKKRGCFASMGLIHGLSWSLTRRKEAVNSRPGLPSPCNASVSDSLETRSKRLNPNEMREIVIRAINIILERESVDERAKLERERDG